MEDYGFEQGVNKGRYKKFQDGHGIRKEQISDEHKKLFDIFDTNKDGTLEAAEYLGIESVLSKAAGSDKILSQAESDQVSSIFKTQYTIENADFLGFTKNLSDASSEIVSQSVETFSGSTPYDKYSTEIKPGEKRITTAYKDGTVQTIYYYADGSYKRKVTEEPQATTTTYRFPNGQTMSQKDFDAKLKQRYKQDKAKYKKYLEATSNNKASLNELPSGRSFELKPASTFAEYKKQFIQFHKIRTETEPLPPKITKEDSPRYAQDLIAQEGEAIAKELFESAKSHIGAVGEQDFIEALNKINTKNVLAVIKGYDKISPDESLIEMIYDEWASTDGEMKNALIGNTNEGISGIYSILSNRAKESGVDNSIISNFDREFEAQMNDDLSGVSSLFKIDPKKLEGIMYGLVQAIENKEISEVMNIVLADVPKAELESEAIGNIQTYLNDAKTAFENQLNNDGIFGDAADAISKIWGSNNTADKVRKDLASLDKQIQELEEAKANGTFESKFAEIFKVAYDASSMRVFSIMSEAYKRANEAISTQNYVKSELSHLLGNASLIAEYTSVSPDPMTSIQITTSETSRESVYAREYEKLARLLSQMGKDPKEELAGIENLSLDEKYAKLREKAKALMSEVDNGVATILGGERIEDLERRYNASYKAAFGLENDIMRRVNDYNISQQKGAGHLKGIVTIGAVIGVGAITQGAGVPAVLSLLGSGAAATAATFTAESIDAITKKGAREALKNEGFGAYLKKCDELNDWHQIAKASIQSGAVVVAMGGATVALSNVAKIAMGNFANTVGGMYAMAGVGQLSGVLAGLGAEYAMTGEITFEGATFVVVLAMVNGVLQVVKISKAVKAAKAEAANRANGLPSEAEIQEARKVLDIKEGEEITAEVLKRAYRKASLKYHPDKNPGVDTSEMMSAINNAKSVLEKTLQVKSNPTVQPAQPGQNPQNGSSEVKLIEMKSVLENDLLKINDSEIPYVYKDLWKSCKLKAKYILENLNAEAHDITKILETKYNELIEDLSALKSCTNSKLQVHFNNVLNKLKNSFKSISANENIADYMSMSEEAFNKAKNKFLNKFLKNNKDSKREVNTLGAVITRENFADIQNILKFMKKALSSEGQNPLYEIDSSLIAITRRQVLLEFNLKFIRIVNDVPSLDIEKLEACNEIIKELADKVTVKTLNKLFSNFENTSIIDVCNNIIQTGKYSPKEINSYLSRLTEQNVTFVEKILTGNYPDIDRQAFENILSKERLLIDNLSEKSSEFLVEFINTKKNYKGLSLSQRRELAPLIDENNYELIDYLVDKGYSNEDIKAYLYNAMIIGSEITIKLLDMGYNKTQVNNFVSSSDVGTLSAKLKGIDIKPLLESVEYQRQKALDAPELYINGMFETKDAAQLAVNTFFEEYSVSIANLAKAFDKEALNALLRKRFDDASEYLDVINRFEDADIELLKNLSNSTNASGKPFLPAQKIELIDLIQAYKDNKISMDKIHTMLESGKVDISELQMDLLNAIMKNSGLTDAEIAQIPTERLTEWDTKYIHLLSKEINGDYSEYTNQTNTDIFKDILRVANLGNFREYINDVNNIYGQTNAKTKEMFKSQNLDYDKWVNPSKGNEIHFVSQDKAVQQLQQVASQIEEDIQTLMNTPIKGILQKRLPKCIKENTFVIPQEALASKDALLKFIENLNNQLSDVWKRAESNLANESRANQARNTLTIREHLMQRIEDTKAIRSQDQGTKNVNYTIKMWDRNPQKDIFQGNYSTCCIGMGGGNGAAMPHYLVNTAYNMIEIIDNTTGNIIGNALCYFVNNSEGKPVLIIDNVEIRNSLKPSNEVGLELREAITQYAAAIAKDVTGNDNTPIYMGSKYNDIPFGDLKTEENNISFLGETDVDNIYMDVYNGWVEKSQFSSKCNLLLLKGKEALPQKFPSKGVSSAESGVTQEDNNQPAPENSQNSAVTGIQENPVQPLKQTLKTEVTRPEVQSTPKINETKTSEPEQVESKPKEEMSDYQKHIVTRHLEEVRTDIEKALTGKELEIANKIYQKVEDHIIEKMSLGMQLFIGSGDIIAMAKYDNFNFERLDKVVNLMKSSNKNVSGHDLRKIMALSDEAFSKLMEITAKHDDQLSLLCKLASVQPEYLDRVQYIFTNTKNPKFLARNLELFRLEDTVWNNLVNRNLLTIESRYSLCIRKLAEITDEEWARVQARNLTGISNLEQLEYLIKLPDDKFQVLTDLGIFDIKSGNIKIADSAALKMIESLTPAQAKRLVDYKLLDRNSSLYRTEAEKLINLLKLPESEFKEIVTKGLLDVKVNNRPLEVGEISALAKYPKNIVDRVINDILPLREDMSIKAAVAYANLPEEVFAKIIKYNLFEEVVTSRVMGISLSGRLVLNLGAYDNITKPLSEGEILHIAKLPEEYIPKMLKILKYNWVKEFSFEDLQKMLTLTDNDCNMLEEIANSHKDDIAGIIKNAIKNVDGKYLLDKTVLNANLKISENLPANIIDVGNSFNLSNGATDEAAMNKYLELVNYITANDNANMYDFIPNILKSNHKYSLQDIEAKAEIYEILKTREDINITDRAFVLQNTSSATLEHMKSVLNNGNKDIQVSELSSYLGDLSDAAIARIFEEGISVVNERVNAQKVKVEANPDLYINGEYSTQEEKLAAVESFFSNYAQNLKLVSTLVDKEALNHLLRLRFADAGSYFYQIRQFDSSEMQVLKEFCNAVNLDGKPFLPAQKVEFIDLITAYRENNIPVDKIAKALENGTCDLAQLKMDLFKQIMRNSGLNETEIASIPSEKLVAWDTKYAHLLSKELNSSDTDVEMLQTVFRAANLDEFSRYITDETNPIGKVNAETKSIFASNGLNYDKWVKPSESNNVHFTAVDKTRDAVSQVASQLIQDIETLRENSGIKSLIDKQFPKCIKDGQFVIPADIASSKAKLIEFANNIIKQLESVWKRAQGNLNNPSRQTNARNTLTIKSHIEQRLSALDGIQTEKSSQKLDITIKMWDRVPQKDLFQGNYSTCCIGMGGGNGSAMPHYLASTTYNMIELVDNTTGKTIGNALCYFATGENNEQILIIDNVEIQNSKVPTEETGMELRKALTQYAANVAKEVTGHDDTKIYLGTKYNDIPDSDLTKIEKQISLTGNITTDEIYMDVYNGWTSDFSKRTVSVKELVKPEPTPDKPSGNTETSNNTPAITEDFIRNFEVNGEKAYTNDYTINQILKVAEKYPNAIAKLFDIKDSNGNLRVFNFGITEEAVQVLDGNPELEEALGVTDANGRYKLELYDLGELLKVSNGDIKYAIDLLKMKNAKGEDIVNFVSDIETYSKANSIDSELTEQLMAKDFDSYQIKNLLPFMKERSADINTLLNMTDETGKQRFTPDFIITIIEDVPNTQFQKFLDILSIKDSNGDYRVCQDETYALVDCFKLIGESKVKEDFFVELLNAKDHRGIRRFKYLNSISDLLKISEEDIPYVKELLEQKNSSGEFRLTTTSGISDFLDILKKNKDFVISLLNLQDSSGDYLYNISGIKYLAEAQEKNPTLVNELLSRKDQDGYSAFYPGIIEEIIKKYNQESYKDNIDNWLSLKNTDGSYRFDGRAFSGLLELPVVGRTKLRDGLLNMKNADGSWSYTPQDVKGIMEAQSFNGCEDFTVSLSKMRAPNGNRRFSGEEIKEISLLHAEKKDGILDFVNAKNTDGSYKYNSFMIKNIASKCKYTRLLPKVTELQTLYDKIVDYCLANNIDYSNMETDTITGYIKVNNETTEISFDPNGTPVRKDTKSNNSQIKYSKMENEAGSSEYTSRWETCDRHFNKLTASVKVQKDSSGNLLYKEYCVPSKEITGKFDIWRQDATGRKYRIGSAEKTNDGKLMIEKSLTSLDGTKYSYVFAEDALGQRLSYSRVVDKDGNVLFTNQQKFKKIDDNHYISTENGVEYDIVYHDDKVVVTRDGKDTVEISIGLNSEKLSGVLSKDLLSVLKQLPGSIYFEIANSGLNKLGKEINGVSENNAHYNPIDNKISLAIENADNLFVLLHELGHMIDFTGKPPINQNKELLAIYEQERAALFNSGSKIEQEAVDYFTAKEHYGNAHGGAITEMIAETNALLYANNTWDVIETRGHYLQQYFPRTFAKIAELLTSSDNTPSPDGGEHVPVTPETTIVDRNFRSSIIGESVKPNSQAVNSKVSEFKITPEIENEIKHKAIYELVSSFGFNGHDLADFILSNLKTEEQYKLMEFVLNWETRHRTKDAHLILSKAFESDKTCKEYLEIIEQNKDSLKNYDIMEDLLKLANGDSKEAINRLNSLAQQLTEIPIGHKFGYIDKVLFRGAMNLIEPYKNSEQHLKFIEKLLKSKGITYSAMESLIEIKDIAKAEEIIELFNKTNQDINTDAVYFALESPENFERLDKVLSLLSECENTNPVIQDFYKDLLTCTKDQFTELAKWTKYAGMFTMTDYYNSDNLKAWFAVAKNNIIDPNNKQDLNSIALFETLLNNTELLESLKNKEIQTDAEIFYRDKKLKPEELIKEEDIAPFDFTKLAMYEDQQQRLMGEEIYETLTLDFLVNSILKMHADLADGYRSFYTDDDGNINTSTNPDSLLKACANMSAAEAKNLLDRIDTMKSRIINNPKIYVNGEIPDETTLKYNVEAFYNNNRKNIFRLVKTLDKEAVDVIMRKRLEEFEEYLDTIGELSNEELDLISQLSNSYNIDGKPFMPSQKVALLDLVHAYSENCMSFDNMKAMIKSERIDLVQLNLDLFDRILKNVGLTDEEISSISLEKKLQWDIKYSHLLAATIRDSRIDGTEEAFLDIIRAANFGDFKQYIQDSSNIYGQTNLNTQTVFNEVGANYDKWVNPPKESEIHLVTRDKNTEKLIQYQNEITAEIEALRKNPGIRGLIDKVFSKCINKDGSFTIPQESCTSKATLEEFTNKLLNCLEPVWKRAEGNLNNEARKVQAHNTLTIRSHITTKLESLGELKEGTKLSKNLDLTVKMWDRIPQKDLFQGNYSTCCIGMGEFNDWSFPNYLLDTAYNMIELVDNNTGKTIGNALCYFVTDENGKPVFIIDNIEIQNSSKPSEDVQIQIRQAMADYAANIAHMVTGNDDTSIYMSGSYNDVPTEDLPQESFSAKFLGDIHSNNVYMDLYGGKTNKEELQSSTLKLFKLK